MQFQVASLASALLLLTSVVPALATPASPPKKTVTLLFLGASPESQAIQVVPADGSTFKINHPELSVSHITVLGQATCDVKGKDGSDTFVAFRGTLSNIADVGPPQVQVSGVCNGY